MGTVLGRGKKSRLGPVGRSWGQSPAEGPTGPLQGQEPAKHWRTPVSALSPGYLCNNICATAQKAAEHCRRQFSAGFCSFLRSSPG
eukprot:566435-Alexandrium_andersonii.AAC.1